jgi:hypothetical protein
LVEGALHYMITCLFYKDEWQARFDSS